MQYFNCLLKLIHIKKIVKYILSYETLNSNLRVYNVHVFYTYRAW